MKTIDDLGFSVPKEIDNYTCHSIEIGIMISNYIKSVEGMNKKSFAKEWLKNKFPILAKRFFDTQIKKTHA